MRPNRISPVRSDPARIAGLLALLALAAGVAGCDRPAVVDGVNLAGGEPSAATEAIDSVSIRARTAFLASDLMEGRAPGSRGGRLAAEYIASEFASLGLEPAAGGDWFQSVPILGVTPSPDLAFSTVDGENVYRPTYLDEYVAWTGVQRERAEAAGEMVYVGYGIAAPERDWNDYREADVEGRILLGLVNDPGGADPSLGFRGDTLTYYGRWTYKFEEAARRGAAGLVLVHTTESAGYGWSVVRNSWSGEQFELPLQEGQPALPFMAWVSGDAAERLLGMAGMELDSLVRAAADRGFRASPLPLRADGSVTSRVRRIESPNVVAVRTGRDSALRNEVVVYTSHYDHLGIGTPEEGDSIYNGARDNASGTATLLEIAEAFARLRRPPRRTVMFAAVTAEEAGLLGSAFLARNPPVGRFVANLNMDAVNMHGRTSDLVQIGGEHSTLGGSFREVCRYLELTPRGDADPEQGYFFRSDQFSFARTGAPALYVDPGRAYVGLPEGTGERREREYREQRYHQPDDEMRPGYGMGGAAQQGEALFLLGWLVSNREAPPAWHPGSPFAPRETGGEPSGEGPP